MPRGEGQSAQCGQEARTRCPQAQVSWHCQPKQAAAIPLCTRSRTNATSLTESCLGRSRAPRFGCISCRRVAHLGDRRVQHALPAVLLQQPSRDLREWGRRGREAASAAPTPLITRVPSRMSRVPDRHVPRAGPRLADQNPCWTARSTARATCPPHLVRSLVLANLQGVRRASGMPSAAGSSGEAKEPAPTNGATRHAMSRTHLALSVSARTTTSGSHLLSHNEDLVVASHLLVDRRVERVTHRHLQGQPVSASIDSRRGLVGSPLGSR